MEIDNPTKIISKYNQFIDESSKIYKNLMEKSDDDGSDSSSSGNSDSENMSTDESMNDDIVKVPPTQNNRFAFFNPDDN